MSFWVRTVLDVHFGERLLVQKITVHWYEFYNGPDLYTGTFRSLFLQKGRGRGTYVDRIFVDCVPVSLKDLTAANKVPA